MRITNNQGLPDVLVRAVQNQRQPKPDSISCTELIDSPLIRRLKLEKWDSLEADVSEMVYSMMGTALHQMVEKHGAGQSEVPLQAVVNGMTVTGTCDHLTDEVITDWKTTSVWSVMLSDDWLKKVEQQLNVYRYLYYKMTGRLVPRLCAVVIFRDWRRSDYKRNPTEYPARNIIEYDFQTWAPDIVEIFIATRLGYHSDTNYVCSMAERWGKPDTWAVKKAGAARALRVFESHDQALNMQLDNPALEIEHRPGECVRCADYCPVRSVCNYGSLQI